MNKMIRWLIGLLVVSVGFLVLARKQGWVGAEKGLAVETALVERQDIIETVIASGKIQPETELTISSEVSGEIIALPVREGDAVQKGDLLVRINPDIYQAAVSRTRAAVNSAKAALASSRAQLIEAKRNFDRNQKLFADKVISQAEMDAAQRGYDVAKLAVESAHYQLASNEATLNEAKRNLARTTIFAPQDGTISMLNSELGERVVGTAQMTGTDILHLSDLLNMEVLVEVNENDIIRVEHGDTALIEVDAFMEEEFKGVVTEIANSANMQSAGVDQVTNFEVKVRILRSSYDHLLKSDSSAPFRPGMTATLEIITQRRRGVPALPIQAVTTRSDTAQKATPKYKREDNEEDSEELFEVVFKAEENQAQLQVVRTGIQDDRYIEITEGLQVGDRVVTGPYSAISKLLDPGERIEYESAAKNDGPAIDTERPAS